MIGDNVAILIPVTYEFRLGSVEALGESLSITPYLGAGVGIATGGGDGDDDDDNGDDDDDDDDTQVGFLLTGGVDVPLGERFTATGWCECTICR